MNQRPPATADRAVVTRSVLVVQTYVVPGPDRLTTAYYEIHLAPDADPNAPRTVLLTKDAVAYEFALAAEGRACRLTASWHHARMGTRRVSVLDTLEAGA